MRLSSFRRNDPEIWLSRVLFEVHIDSGEYNPLAVRRDYRFGYAFERHHVFEGERPLGGVVRTLRPDGCGPYANKCKSSEAAPCSEAMHVSSQLKRATASLNESEKFLALRIR